MVPQIINIVEGVPTVSHRVVAENVGIEAKSILDMITRNYEDFQSFGTLAFLNRESNGGRPQKEYMLNEQQAILLMTYLKNTPIVRQFKMALVKAFYELKLIQSQSQSPSKYESILHDHIVDLNERIEKLEKRPLLLPNPRIAGAPFSDEEKETIRGLRQDYNCSTVEIARRVGCSERSVRRILKTNPAKHQGIFERMAHSLFGDVA